MWVVVGQCVEFVGNVVGVVVVGWRSHVTRMWLCHDVQHTQEINKLMVSCLAFLQTSAIGTCHPKLSIHIHQIPCIFLTGKLMRCMLKYHRTHNLLLFCVILNRGRHKSWKCYCLHIFTNSFHPSQTSISKICSVHFLGLQMFCSDHFFETTNGL